ncbi:MAG: hypothetical protein U5K38_06690 [Woeseiaceae bacterium]|nr:hypothetical protein [Woeseiaceae bacterium]
MEVFEPSGEFILMTPGHFHEGGGFRDQEEKTKDLTGEIPQDYVLAKDDIVVAMTEQKSGLLGSRHSPMLTATFIISDSG